MVMSGDDVCWCVVFGTQVGVSVFNVMWLVDDVGDHCPS